MKTMKRIVREMGDMAKAPELCKVCKVEPINDDLNRLQLTLLPVSGNFANTRIPFEITFPDNYSVSPPTIRCDVAIYHPNIESSGDICFSLLEEDWSPSFSLTTIANGLLWLLDNGNFDDALVCNVPEDDYDEMLELAIRGEHADDDTGCNYDDIRVDAAKPSTDAVDVEDMDYVIAFRGLKLTRREFLFHKDALRPLVPAVTLPPTPPPLPPVHVPAPVPQPVLVTDVVTPGHVARLVSRFSSLISNMATAAVSATSASATLRSASPKTSPAVRSLSCPPSATLLTDTTA